LSIITFQTTVSSSENRFISIVSTRLLVTTIAARILPSADANILYFFMDQPFWFELYTVLECTVCLCCPQLSSLDCLLVS